MNTQTTQIKKDLIKMREDWRKLPDYGCYWSSPDNKRGLQLTPTIEPGRVWVEMTIDREHSGFPGIAHGGIAYSVIDGLMGWYIMSHEGRGAFTTQTTTKYFGPMKVGKSYILEAVVDPDAPPPSSKAISMLGRVYNANKNDPQNPLVEVRAHFMLPKRELAKAVLGMDFGDYFKEFFPE